MDTQEEVPTSIQAEEQAVTGASTFTAIVITVTNTSISFVAKLLIFLCSFILVF